MSTLLSIDPDVARAAAIAKRFYLDESLYRLSLERVFARSWQWLGDLSDLATPLTLSPRDLLPGSLDEPLLLARDAAGMLRCLSNVCTHRGKLLVEAPCRADPQGLRCGYHGRRFDLSGRAWFSPGFDGVPDFPCAIDHLCEVPFTNWRSLGFARVRPHAFPNAKLESTTIDRVDHRLCGGSFYKDGKSISKLILAVGIQPLRVVAVPERSEMLSISLASVPCWPQVNLQDCSLTSPGLWSCPREIAPAPLAVLLLRVWRWFTQLLSQPVARGRGCNYPQCRQYWKYL